MNGRATIQKYADLWNAGDREAFLACYTDDCEITTPWGTEKGQAGAAAFWAATKDPAPGNKVRISVLIEVGDTVVEEGVVEGTNTGPLTAPDGSQIPATGRDFSVPLAGLHTVRDGKISSSRFYWDGMGYMAQLGLLPG